MRATARTTLIIAVLAFAGSFAGTVVTRSQPPDGTQPGQASANQTPLARFLDLDAERTETLQREDATFPEDHAAMQAALNDARLALAELLESGTATDEELRQQTEVVIEAHNKLERRVVEHLILVRDQLEPEQQKRLLGLCADGVRKHCRRTGRGQGYGRDRDGGRGYRGGRGNGGGRGHGHGAGRGDSSTEAD